MIKIATVCVAGLMLAGCNVVVQDRPVARVATYPVYQRPEYVPLPPPRPYYLSAPNCRIVDVRTPYGIRQERVCN